MKCTVVLPRSRTVGVPFKKRALKDNRLDDANEEVIKRRLQTYKNESKPLLNYYGKDLVPEIDISQPPALALDRILAKS